MASIPKAALEAAHAASKKKGSSFEITYQQEERIREVLKVCSSPP